jgi:hypothetical protein
MVDFPPDFDKRMEEIRSSLNAIAKKPRVAAPKARNFATVRLTLKWPNGFALWLAAMTVADLYVSVHRRSARPGRTRRA